MFVADLHNDIVQRAMIGEDVGKLTKQGHRTRVYIPYGEKWYEYSIRRLQENPTIGLQIAKAFLMPWTNRP